MTVKELINHLIEFPDDTPVCIGDWYPDKGDPYNEPAEGYQVHCSKIETAVINENWIYLDGHGNYVTGTIVTIS